MTTIVQLIKENPFEVFFGLLALVLGAFLSTQADLIGTAGTTLAITSGAYLSWVATKWFSESRVRRAMKEGRESISISLEALNRRLSIYSGQIGLAVSQAERGVVDNGTCYSLVRQASGNLHGVVNEIEILIGDEIDPTEMLRTAETIRVIADNMANIFRDDVPEVPAPEAMSVLSQLESLSSDLNSKLSGLLSDTGRARAEAAPCPNCESIVNFSIGTLRGESASPSCPVCGSRFHAHRAADGSIFTNPWRGASPPIPIQCPNCSEMMNARIPPTAEDSFIRYCLGCHSKLEIDVAGGEVIDCVSEEPLAGSLLDEPIIPSLIVCPQCMQYARTFYRKDDKHFAVCDNCSRLMIATSP